MEDPQSVPTLPTQKTTSTLIETEHATRQLLFHGVRTSWGTHSALLDILPATTCTLVFIASIYRRTLIFCSPRISPIVQGIGKSTDLKYPYFSQTELSFNGVKCILNLIFISFYQSNKILKCPSFWQITNESPFLMFRNAFFECFFHKTCNCMTNVCLEVINRLGHLADYLILQNIPEEKVT